MEQELNYKDTLNLPKTAFPMKADLPKREPQFLERWARENIYSAMRKKGAKAVKYILHDGPPYANGDIHIGHALNKILKDIIVKYKTMRGFDAPYVPGWDCHGLPIEHQLFKELKISRHQISQSEFRKKAFDYAMRYVDIQRKEFERLGIFADWEKPYLTIDYKYEADIIESFGKLVEAGYIYKGRKPVNWCMACETALAEAEVEYENHNSPSIYVKFKLAHHSTGTSVASNDGTYLIIWTTTPWTLVSNVAVAVHPGLEYASVRMKNGEIWIMLNGLLESSMVKFGISDYKVEKVIKGRELEGLQYEHPFMNRKSNVILADFISKEEGAGCVHIAPGHGQEDYEAGLKYKLDILMPVKSDGIFDEGAGDFKGLHIFKANPIIIERLLNSGNLVFQQEISHSYPHCWRCKKPIIFRATSQWFINVAHKNMRLRTLSAIKEVSWVPQSGEKRISSMIESRPDWCLSRQRYWGIPIPAIYCDKCDEAILDARVIESLRCKVEKAGADVWFVKDVSEFLPADLTCPKCNNNKFKKESDIMDVWFDSGVSHQAVLLRRPELKFPADLYLEGSDQHRGWFQSALLTSVGIMDKAPFKSVLTHGFVMDGEGRKMSKSLGNVVSPQDVVNKYGGDILRLWVSSCDYSSDIRVSPVILDQAAEAYRKIRNTFKFLLGNIYDYDPKKNKIEYSRLTDIDKWALSKTHALIKDVAQFYESYQFHRIYRLVYNFCTQELSSVYLDILKDRLYTEAADSLKRRAAQSVMYEIITMLSRSLAPILPVTAEEVWDCVKIYESAQSIHLAPMPEACESYINTAIERDWYAVLSLRSSVLEEIEKVREKKVVGSSQEARVIIHYENNSVPEAVKKYESELASYFIVSQVEIIKEDLLLDYKDHSYYNTNLPDGAARIQIKVERADGKKCVRCWNYTNDVGKESKHPGICLRCVSALEDN